MLSCNCDYDDDDFDEFYYEPNNYSFFKKFRRKRCISCQELIEYNSLVAEFKRFRIPHSEIEERIYVDFVPLAAHYMCEACTDIYFNLRDLGFCVDIWENMNDVLEEYKKLSTNEVV